MEGNLEINKKEGYVWVSVNPRIYSLDVIYSAAYVFIDDCYIMIDGNPQEEVLVELRPKEKDKDLKILGRKFNTELVNYATYAANCARNAGIREAILKRVLLTNDIGMQNEFEAQKNDVEYLEKEAKPWLNDKEVMTPWEEKYGKNENKQGKK